MDEPLGTPESSEPALVDAVCDALERIEAGDSVTTEWLRRRYPGSWRSVRDAFAIHLAARAEDAFPGLVGPYRLEEWLGRGGMGTVYRAGSPQGGAGDSVTVAVKVLHRHLLERPGAVERFRREAEIGARIRHPNVVATLGFGAPSDGSRTHFLVMEYVRGQTLRALVDELSAVPEELCRHIGREVAKGLSAIHAAGVVHRDLKPENVLITEQHVVKVMDLGVARIDRATTRLSDTGSFLGSVLYAAPEQFGSGAEADPRTDLYAVGVLLFELATGAHPHAGEDVRAVVRNVLERTPRRCAEVNPQISAFFDEVVHTLLRKERARRFASADELVRVLEAGEDSDWWRARTRAIRVETQRPPRRLRIPRETGLHGRVAEMETLRSLYDRAKAGDGGAVLFEGEAGVGKSRLVGEFVERLRDLGEGVNALCGSYPPGGAATAAGAFAAAFAEQIGTEEEDARAVLRETPLLAPGFAALLRGDAAPEGSLTLTRETIQACFRNAARALASAWPTIVSIEDLHLASEEGRALFVSLALAAPGHRILLVGTARPGIDAAWLTDVQRAGAEIVRLGRLDRASVLDLLTQALGSRIAADESGEAVHVRSDGNPLFVLEILRALRDERPVPGSAGGLARRIEELDVPAAIRRLIRVRVEGLDPADADLLGLAACCGFSFDPLLVAAAAKQDATETLRRLSRIEARHRLVHSAGRRFAFDHHLVQEVIEESLSALLRELHHAAIAAALEERTGASAAGAADGALASDLAEHWLAAARGERAAPYLEPALQWLESRHLNDAFLRLADRALAAPGLLGGPARCRVHLRKASRLHDLGRSDEERAAADEALALADASGDVLLRVLARTAMASYLRHAGRYAEIEAVTAEGLALARASGDPRAEMPILAQTANFLVAVDRNREARGMIGRQLRLARALGDLREEASATVSLGHILRKEGRHDKAAKVLLRGASLAGTVGDPRREILALLNLGHMAGTSGRDEEALRAFERASAAARSIGDRRQEVTAVGALGVIRVMLGHLAEARTLHERELSLARDMRSPSAEGFALHHLANLAIHFGDWEQAEAWDEQATRIARELGGHPALEAAVRGDRGQTLAARGAVAEADACQRATRELARSAPGLRHLGPQAAVALAESAFRAGRLEEARLLLEEARTEAAESGSPESGALAVARLAAMRARDPADARREIDEVLASCTVWVRLEIHLLMWRATGDGSELAAARRLLDVAVANAPPEYRASMVARVPVHREIAEAAAAAGI